MYWSRALHRKFHCSNRKWVLTTCNVNLAAFTTIGHLTNFFVANFLKRSCHEVILYSAAAKGYWPPNRLHFANWTEDWQSMMNLIQKSFFRRRLIILQSLIWWHHHSIFLRKLWNSHHKNELWFCRARTPD